LAGRTIGDVGSPDLVGPLDHDLREQVGIDLVSLIGHLEAQARNREMERRKGSLAQLCDAYVESLRAAGKQSADEVAEKIAAYLVKGLT